MSELPAVRTTLMLAAVSTAILVVLAMPLAWWLARTHSRWRAPVEALATLPLVLPPTVLGFYLLLLLGANSPLSGLWSVLGGPLAFSFAGLVVGSVIYSLPFVVRPLVAAFEAVGQAPVEVAATLGAGRWDRFASVVLPSSRNGILGAAILGFAHTLGEFGVVLMIGGNIPGETRVMSIAIYDHVERLDYGTAHWLSGVLLVFAFLSLWTVIGLGRRQFRY